MKKQPYNQKRKQLKGLVKRLNLLLKQQNKEAESKIERLVLRIRELIRELSYLFSRRELKRVLGAAAVIIGLGFTQQTNAQSFAPPQVNPFGLDSIQGYIAAPAFADLDGDGDLDLLVGETYGEYSNSDKAAMQYFENTGTASNPQFAAPEVNPFGLDSVYYIAFPAFADLDGDGDIDLLVGESYGVMPYFENTGSASNPQFAAPIANPFGLNSVKYYAFPAFVDLDGDGDIDLLVGEYDGAIQYFENTGSASDPQFASPQVNPFGLDSLDGNIAIPSFSDLDNDGDLDLLVGSNTYYSYGAGDMYYFENTGNATNPQFAAPQLNPFGLVPTKGFAIPAFADLDNDGDDDILAGEFYGAMQYFENTVIDGISEVDNLKLDLYPNPVQDVLNLKVDEQIDRIEIIDLSGKVINAINNPGNRVELSDLHPGLYMIRITGANHQSVVKKIQKI